MALFCPSCHSLRFHGALDACAVCPFRSPTNAAAALSLQFAAFPRCRQPQFFLCLLSSAVRGTAFFPPPSSEVPRRAECASFSSLPARLKRRLVGRVNSACIISSVPPFPFADGPRRLRSPPVALLRRDQRDDAALSHPPAWRLFGCASPPFTWDQRDDAALSYPPTSRLFDCACVALAAGSKRASGSKASCMVRARGTEWRNQRETPSRWIRQGCVISLVPAW